MMHNIYVVVNANLDRKTQVGDSAQFGGPLPYLNSAIIALWSAVSGSVGLLGEG